MKLFNKVAIIGMGLIGGSIAGAIKKSRVAQEVIGVSRSKNTIVIARSNHLIDKGSQDINIIKDADLVILAAPVKTILKLSPLISKIVKPGCLISDVGSTKRELVNRLDKIFTHYVGAHPLAGSEKHGVINASPGIFKNSICILTPTKKTDRKDLLKIKRFWERLGARVKYLTPDTHDKILAFSSHLPHVAAFSLINTVPDNCLAYASSGLKDTTRIAASDSRLWLDIFLSNRKCLLNAVGSLQGNISRLKSAIQKQDKRLLIGILKKAQKKRESLG